MTNEELIKQVTDLGYDHGHDICYVAAIRIGKLQSKLDKAVAALREIKSVECIHCTDLFNELADAVLGEAKGDEKQQIHRDQRESFARAEAAFGSDADEAEHRAAWVSGDPARIAKSAEAEAARLAQFDKIKGETK